MGCAESPDPPVYLRHEPERNRIKVIVPICGTFRIDDDESAN